MVNWRLWIQVHLNYTCKEKVIKLTCVVITGGAADDDLNYTCKEKVIKELSVIIHYTL